MGEKLEEVKSKVEAVAADDGFATLASRLGASAKADAVFGTPVERDGVTVIPVARVRWGFGGGRGRREGKTDDGFGGGGGVQAAPLGFIEVRDGAAQYQRIHDPLRLAIAALLLPISVAAAGVALILTFAALARSTRGMFSIPKAPWRFHRRRS